MSETQPMTDGKRGVLLGLATVAVFIIGDSLHWPKLVSMVVAVAVVLSASFVTGHKFTRWQWLALVVWVAVGLLFDVGHR